MTDYYIKPYAGPWDKIEEDEPLLPLYFFDNDDGFWTKYMREKHRKWESNDMIVHRKYIKV